MALLSVSSLKTLSALESVNFLVEDVVGLLVDLVCVAPRFRRLVRFWFSSGKMFYNCRT